MKDGLRPLNLVVWMILWLFQVSRTPNLSVKRCSMLIVLVLPSRQC